LSTYLYEEEEEKDDVVVLIIIVLLLVGQITEVEPRLVVKDLRSSGV
jgi:hypothetical protein